jgi:DNA invertase Pin-like site-specific DNA recombinase
MPTIAYVRVSTNGQDVASQRLAIHEFAHRHGFQIDDFVQIQASSRWSPAARGVEQLLAHVATGDTVIVSELSRLGRSLGQIIQTVDQLLKRHIRFIAIKENIQLAGAHDMQTKVMVTLFGLFAELERDLISARTREGLAAAKTKGKRLGRPKGAVGKSKLNGREAEIRLLLEKEVSWTSIAKIMGVARSTLQHFVHSRHLAS